MYRTTGTRVSPDAFSPEPNLPLWESLMRQAVSDERAHRAALARNGYERALEIARRLLDAPPPDRSEDCLAALVVSHHNLADLLAAQGDTDDAARHLCRAHDTLIALHLDGERVATLRHAALRHSRETHVALIRHLARYGPQPLITRTLDSASLAMQRNEGAARH